MKKFAVLSLYLTIFGLLLTACSSTAIEPVSVDVELKEYTFIPQLISAKVGQEVTLQLKNTGVVDHELMIGRDVKTIDGRPAGYTTDLFQSSNVAPEITGGASSAAGSQNHAHSGTMVVVPPGGQASITFPVTQAMVGEWEMGCFSQLGVHYDAGMRGKFIVTP